MQAVNEYLLNLYKSLDFKNEKDLSEKLNMLTKSVCNFGDADRASIWLYNDKKSCIICNSLYLAKEDRHENGLELCKQDFPTYFKALEESRIIEATDAHTHQATSCFSESYLKPLGIKSMYDTPIWDAGEVTGVLCLEYFQPKTFWKDEEKYFLTGIADLAAKILDKAKVLKLLNQLQTFNDELQTELDERTEALKEAQQFIIEQDRAKALGTLTVGISHELKNPTHLILNANQIIVEHLAQSTQTEDSLNDMRGCAEIIEDSTQRIYKVLQNMGANDDIKKDLNKKFSIKESIDSAIHLIHAPENIKFKIDDQIGDEQLQLFCVRGEGLKQALMNIFNNSCTALHSKQNTNAEIIISLIPYKEFCSIEISDNGVGMEEMTLKKIYDPFFTTQNVGEGIGLGMYIVKDLINSLGGKIDITSQVDVGTTVKIALPKLEKLS